MFEFLDSFCNNYC